MVEIERLLKYYLDYLEIEKNRSLKTRENYEHYLDVFVREMKIRSPRDITEEAVRSFRMRLARKSIKKITQSYYVVAIRNFLKYLAKRNFKVMPADVIELPKIARRDIEILDYNEL